MPTKIQQPSRDQNSPTGTAASLLSEVCAGGHLAVYSASIGRITSEWSLRQRADIHGFVRPSSIGRIERALGQKRDLYYAVHKPGAASRKGSYITTVWPGNGHVGGWVLGRREIEQDFRGLHPDLIKVLKRSWQLFAVDTVWGRNTYLWDALTDLV